MMNDTAVLSLPIESTFVVKSQCEENYPETEDSNGTQTSSKTVNPVSNEDLAAEQKIDTTLFSEDTDRMQNQKCTNVDSPGVNYTTEDLLKLAEMNDALKSRRSGMVHRLSQSSKCFLSGFSKTEQEDSKGLEKDGVVESGIEENIYEESFQEQTMQQPISYCDPSGNVTICQKSDSSDNSGDECADQDEHPKECEGIEEVDESNCNDAEETDDTCVVGINTIVEERATKIMPIPALPSRIRTFNISETIKGEESLTEVVLPAVEGYLKKKSGFIGWDLKWVRIKDRRLTYFSRKDHTRLHGCIDFDLVAASIQIVGEPTVSKAFKLFIQGYTKSFQFKADTHESMMYWIEMIRTHIDGSNGLQISVSPYMLANKKFWKYQRISNDTFTSSVESGDLLLFRTKNFGAKIQRSFTMSHYDHVAMLLKYKSGEIVLFESTGRDGVGLCRWSTFLANRWQFLYDKLVHRKLDMPRDDQTVGSIERFVRGALGKKYKINPSKLLKRYSSVKKVSGDVVVAEEKTFFCSELIAACYKKLGILPTDISSSQYWPGNFSCEKKLNMLNGAKLGEEMVIDFNLF